MKVYFDKDEWWPWSVVEKYDEKRDTDKTPVEITRADWEMLQYHEKQLCRRIVFHEYLRKKYGMEIL